ncbi:hypothetical protein BsWGS_14585 [Bradybaena similaris]
MYLSGSHNLSRVHTSGGVSKMAVLVDHIELVSVEMAVLVDHIELVSVEMAVLVDHIELVSVEMAVLVDHIELVSVKCCLPALGLCSHKITKLSCLLLLLC